MSMIYFSSSQQSVHLLCLMKETLSDMILDEERQKTITTNLSLDNINTDNITLTHAYHTYHTYTLITLITLTHLLTDTYTRILTHLLTDNITLNQFSLNHRDEVSSLLTVIATYNCKVDWRILIETFSGPCMISYTCIPHSPYL